MAGKIKFCVREYIGAEILPISSEGQIINEPIKNENGILIDMEVSAWGMTFIVKNNENGFYLYSPNLMGIIEFNKDDRECYVCTGLINKKGLKKLTLSSK
ncbi:MAG TPA: hypothetical protein VKN14_05600 [Flavobacteriaceae bacterium]|nr:hypothetical protein [Flavobacteriaceae bacterium]